MPTGWKTAYTTPIVFLFERLNVHKIPSKKTKKIISLHVTVAVTTAVAATQQQHAESNSI